MVLSGKSLREKLVWEKSHSISLTIRVEDRLHRDIIQDTDKCYFTIRTDPYSMGLVDTDAQYMLDAYQNETERGMTFRFDIQATSLNLDPDEDWYYDITYVRDGYSMSIMSGEMDIAANPTNRGAGQTFTGGWGVFDMICSVSDRQLLNVTSSMPVPLKGDDGRATYIADAPLATDVGGSAIVPAELINSFGKEIQTGDILFSSVTNGVLALIIRREMSGGGIVSVEAETQQVYGLEPTKALLDVDLRPANVSAVGYLWDCPYTSVPLPPDYHYLEGDLLFSSSASSPTALDKKLVISQVLNLMPTMLHVKTVIVFPMYADASAMDELFNAKVDKVTTVNTLPLSSNIVINADKIPDGSFSVMMNYNERIKLNGVELNATKNAPDSALRDRSTHTGTQPISSVAGLQTALDDKVGSQYVDILWRGTQSSYDALPSKDPRTLYFIEQG